MEMENSLKNEFEKLKEEALTLASETDFLQLLTEKFPEGVVFSTSFSYEDQVITHLVKNLNVDIFTLDTEDFLNRPMKPGLLQKLSSKKRDQSLLSGY